MTYCFGCCWTPALQHRHSCTQWNPSLWWRISNRSGWGVHFLLEGPPYRFHSRCWFCWPFFFFAIFDGIPWWHQWTFDVHVHPPNPGTICHTSQCICSYSRLLGWRENTFYAALHSTLQHVPHADKLLLLGDFNARVGANHQVWQSVNGRHGVGKSNNNGLHLLEVCSEFSLCITNTMFQLQNKFKTSWMHLCSKHWHLIDFVIVHRSNLRDVKITRALRGADCWTDHFLIRSQLTMRARPPSRMKQPCKRLL